MSTCLSLMCYDCQGPEECYVLLSNITPNNQLSPFDPQYLFLSHSRSPLHHFCSLLIAAISLHVSYLPSLKTPPPSAQISNTLAPWQMGFLCISYFSSSLLCKICHWIFQYFTCRQNKHNTPLHIFYWYCLVAWLPYRGPNMNYAEKC